MVRADLVGIHREIALRLILFVVLQSLKGFLVASF
jgi:hypothetical protein